MDHAIVKVTRGGAIESLHQGFVAVVDIGGKPQAGYGNSEYESFLRSSAKPFQAYPLVFRKGLKEYGFTVEETALLCSSHTGEQKHVETVRSIFSKIEFDEGHLKCGTHPPLLQEEAERVLSSGGKYLQVQNNCSGKHAGMLALSNLLGEDPSVYLDTDSVVQQSILKAVAFFSDMREEDLPAGVDGCSAPIFIMPLYKMALMYARLAQGADHHLKTLRNAMVAYPYIVSGTERFDFRFMEATNGRFVSKTGAEGVQCVGIIDGGPRPECTGWGVAVKILDGNIRAKGPAVIEALDQLGVLTDRDRDNLQGLKTPIVYNHARLKVGTIEPIFTLD